MRFALNGGIHRLEKEYIAAASVAANSLRFISRNELNFVQKNGKPDVLIMLTNKLSHYAKRKALQLARSQKIPLNSYISAVFPC